MNACYRPFCSLVGFR